MFVYGVVSPHPPIILTEIGGDEAKKAEKTIKSLKKCGEIIDELAVNHILIISPHTDHGFNVPLYYLQGDVPDQNIRQILVGMEDYSWYFELGKEKAKEIEEDQNVWAVIASADLSHALKSTENYQYNPAGPKLDKAINEAFPKKSHEDLLGLDREMIRNAAECGLRSIMFLMGVQEYVNSLGKETKARVLSYEHPWGVGYMVADVKLK